MSLITRGRAIARAAALHQRPQDTAKGSKPLPQIWFNTIYLGRWARIWLTALALST